MRDVRVLGVRTPYVADFLETNVRLYGIDVEGRRSVVFLSLAARFVYRLPYVFSAMAFLTERWTLHSRFYGGTATAQISHPAWPLRRAELLELDDGLVAASGLPAPVGAPVVLFSDGVDVRLGLPEPLPAPGPRPGPGTARR